MILFKKVRWKNFLSTGNNFTEIDLTKHKSTLIVGTNGSGKSTILDAISFALYNKPFRKINKPQLVNSINGKDLCVELEFVVGNANYKIVRGIKPTKFEIYKNDMLLNQDADSKDYQEVVEKQIVKMNHRTFSQVVVLGSSTYVPFMQLPAAQRREVIEDLLDIQVFTTMNTLLKGKVSTNQDDLKQAKYDSDLIDEKINIQNSYISSLKKDVQNKVDENVEKIVIVMDEIDAMNNGDKSGINSLIKLIRPKKTKKQKVEEVSFNPIICIGNYQINKKIKELMKVCHTFELKTPSNEQISSLLVSMNLKFEKVLNDNIIAFIQGDLRKLVSIYQMADKKNNILQNDIIQTIFQPVS